MKKFFIIILILAALAAYPFVSFASRLFSSSMNTVAEQIDPARLLQEYENFKNIHAILTSKQASIRVLSAKVTTFLDMYKDTPRKDWPRDDRQMLGQYQSERDGLVLNFNTLAADYNARMAKINYRFCNIGDLPQGATEPLPREYVLYLER